MHLRVTGVVLISTLFCESIGSLAVLGIEGKESTSWETIFVTAETMKWILLVPQRNFVSRLS